MSSFRLMSLGFINKSYYLPSTWACCFPSRLKSILFTICEIPHIFRVRVSHPPNCASQAVCAGKYRTTGLLRSHPDFVLAAFHKYPNYYFFCSFLLCQSSYSTSLIFDVVFQDNTQCSMQFMPFLITITGPPIPASPPL